MKKNYWYFLAIFVAFVSMLTLMPYRLAVAQTEEDEMDKTITEEENGFGQSDTFEPGEPTPADMLDDQTGPKEEDGGGKGDDDSDNTDDDNGPR